MRMNVVIVVLTLAAAASKMALAQSNAPESAGGVGIFGNTVEIAAALVLAGGALLLLAKAGQIGAQVLGFGKGGSGGGGAAGQANAQAKNEQGNISMHMDGGSPAPTGSPGTCGFASLRFHEVLAADHKAWREQVCTSVDNNTRAVVELCDWLKGRAEIDAEVERRVKEEMARVNPKV